MELGFGVEDLVNERRLRKEEVEDLQEWLRKNGYEILSDQQVAQFILACDRDSEYAKLTIQGYFKARSDDADLFGNRILDREDLQNAAAIADLNIMPRRTSKGSVVLLYRLVDTDYTKFEMDSTLKIIGMMLDAAIFDYPPTGLIILVDIGQMSLMHLQKAKLGVVRRFLHYLQECLPVKLEEVHVLNTVFLVEKFLSLIRPFMKESLSKKLFLHSAPIDMEKFQEQYVEKDCLPQEYEGALSSTASLHLETMEKLRGMADFFKADEEQREIIVQDLMKL